MARTFTLLASATKVDTGYTMYPYDANNVPRSSVTPACRIEYALSPNIVDNILNAGTATQYRAYNHPADPTFASFKAGDIVQLNNGVLMDSFIGTAGIFGAATGYHVQGTAQPICGVALEDATAAAAAKSSLYTFTVSSDTAVYAGATYTNNSQTFRVVHYSASSTTVLAEGTGDPAASGTLTLASEATNAASDATLTFSAWTNGSLYYPQVEVLNKENVYRMTAYFGTASATSPTVVGTQTTADFIRKHYVGSLANLINLNVTAPDSSTLYFTGVQLGVATHAYVKIVGVPTDAALLATHEFCPVLVKFLDFSTVAGDPTLQGLQL